MAKLVGSSTVWYGGLFRDRLLRVDVDKTAGIIAPVTTLTSADSICHLAEELHDAAKWLPRCMVGAVAFNFVRMGPLLCV